MALAKPATNQEELEGASLCARTELMVGEVLSEDEDGEETDVITL